MRAASLPQSIQPDFESGSVKSLPEPCRRFEPAEGDVIEYGFTAWPRAAGEHRRGRQKSESWVMWSWEKVKAAFTARTPVSPDARRLNGSSEGVLSASIKLLPPGERGWITLPEAAALFSRMDGQYAFGEMDDEGKANLEAFAAQREHRCDVQFAPIENSVYFIRT
jgi:hypothetical protein